jgi:serine/threonine-protein kinase
MDAKAQKQLLERARSLEKSGQADAAIKVFREAGALEDAARLLGASKRPRDAGQLLFESLRVQPAQVGQLDGAGKKRALMSAIFFSKAGENDLAVQLFMALGEQARAVELLQRAGDHVGAARLSAMKPGQFESAPMIAKPQAVGGQSISFLAAQKLEQQGKLQLALEAYVQLKRFGDAGRMAQQLSQNAQAAQLYADAGMPYESAEAYLATGDTGKALENLTRVQRDDPRYRAAAVMGVRLASNLGALDFRFEHFLGPFVKSGPRDAQEVPVFDLLAQLYLAHDFPGNAKEALEKILEKDPRFPGARERLAQADEALRPSAAVARSLLGDAELHKKKTMLDLGELPDLEPDATLMRHDPKLLRKVTAPPAEEAGPEFAPGVTIAGRYRIEEQIGQGGMAAVFKAYDLELEEHVALKVFGAEKGSDVLVARFRQELKLSRQLVHPNIIRLYDIGLYQGHRYISMELLVGTSLKTRLRERLAIDTALDYLVQACQGLQAAHDAGVVHRDVKPDNFFIADSGVLKVMDFGIAKQYAAPGVTVAGSIAGTPLYMSPEQISNFSTVSHLTDLYALGVCAYEMCTGSLPFNHEELVPLLMMHVNDAPEPPRQRNPQLPAELDSAILKLLEKEPARRYQSCRELGSELGAIRRRYTAK